MDKSSRPLLERAFGVLDHLARGPARFTDLERGLGLNRTSLTRLLGDLVALGQVAQVDGMYLLGVRGRAAANRFLELPEAIRSQVQSILDNLALRHLRAAGLMEPLGRMTMTIVAKAQVADGMGFSRVGREQGLHVTHGFGRLFLAWRNRVEVADAYALMAHLQVSVRPAFDEVLEGLATIRETGEAQEMALHQQTVHRYVVPVRVGGEGPHFALGLIGAALSRDETGATFVQLHRAAGEIATVLAPAGPWPPAATGNPMNENPKLKP